MECWVWGTSRKDSRRGVGGWVGLGWGAGWVLGWWLRVVEEGRLLKDGTGGVALESRREEVVYLFGPDSVERRPRFGVFDLEGLGEEEREWKPKVELESLRKELGRMRRKRWDLGRAPAGCCFVSFGLVIVEVGGTSWDGGIQGARRWILPRR